MQVVWKPYGKYLDARVLKFAELHGIKDKNINSLRKKSCEDIEWFWSSVEKFLGLKWQKPYKKILDTSSGIKWAKWFPDGKINIADNCLNGDPVKKAIIWEGEEGQTKVLTYKGLSELVARISSGLRKYVKKGDRIGIFMPLVPETVAVFLAACKIGAIIVPIFSGYGPEAISTRLNDSEAKILFTANGFYRRGKLVNMKDIADEAVKNSPSVENVVVLKRTEDKFKINKNDILFENFIGDIDNYSFTEETSSEDPFMIAYTSGTTGKPKGSVHVHGGFLVKIAEEVAFQVDMRDDDILFWITDLGWIMGPWEIVGGLSNKGTIFLYDGAPDWPEPSRIFSLIQKHKITILGISPTAVRSISRYGEEILKYDTSSLRMFGSTGEPWNYEPYMWLFEKVGKKNLPIINLSGGTEVGACFLSPHPCEPLKPMSLAGPALGMDIDIFDEEGKTVEIGRVGELVCKKPWPGMTRGLWKAPERYLETYWSRWEDVWVHGDWASRDEDGFWFLHGRSDDTIKIAGKRVGPAEVESAAVSHKSVIEAAAIGIPDEVKGEAIVVFAVVKGDVEISDKLREEIKDTISEKLGKTLRPKEVRFTKMLPKTRNAKIMRRLIKAKYLGKPLGDISNLENPEAINEIENSV